MNLDRALLEGLKATKHQKNIRNPYKRMLYQNHAEISIFEKHGLPRKHVLIMRRIVKPITVVETLILPIIILITNLLKLRLKKRFILEFNNVTPSERIKVIKTIKHMQGDRRKP